MNASRRRACAAASARGFSLVEVLITMIILTAGLIGAAHMQLWAIKFGQESAQRGSVTHIGASMLENIRVMGGGDAYTAAPDSGATCNLTPITAENDVVCFYRKIADAESLPYSTAKLHYGTAKIEAEDSDGDGTDDLYSVTIYWFDRGHARQGDQTEAVLDTPEKCQAARAAGSPRIWSASADEGLTWPYSTPPDEPICMLFHRWTVQV